MEDEKHFIFCPLYEPLRKDFFNTLDSFDNSTWQRCNNEMERFLFIVQPANKEIALAVCKYSALIVLSHNDRGVRALIVNKQHV